MDYHAKVWPLELLLGTPTIRCGPSFLGDEAKSGTLMTTKSANDYHKMDADHHKAEVP